jgi:hypothetical protein
VLVASGEPPVEAAYQSKLPLPATERVTEPRPQRVAGVLDVIDGFNTSTNTESEYIFEAPQEANILKYVLELIV